MTLHAPQGEERDPQPLWSWMWFLVAFASLDYFTVALTSTITWAAYARFIALPLPEAALIDQVTLWASRSLIWVLLICAIATLRLAYRLTRNLEIRGVGSD